MALFEGLVVQNMGRKYAKGSQLSCKQSLSVVKNEQKPITDIIPSISQLYIIRPFKKCQDFTDQDQVITETRVYQEQEELFRDQSLICCKGLQGTVIKSKQTKSKLMKEFTF